MRDAKVMLIALLLATPFACSHDSRGPASPPQGNAGNDVGPPAPTSTNEPTVPGVPNALNGADRGKRASPPALADASTTWPRSALVQPVPGTGGTLGTGGTIGTGGTPSTGGTLGTGGAGAAPGVGGISTGG